MEHIISEEDSSIVMTSDKGKIIKELLEKVPLLRAGCWDAGEHSTKISDSTYRIYASAKYLRIETYHEIYHGKKLWCAYTKEVLRYDRNKLIKFDRSLPLMNILNSIRERVEAEVTGKPETTELQKIMESDIGRRILEIQALIKQKLLCRHNHSFYTTLNSRKFFTIFSGKGILIEETTHEPTTESRRFLFWKYFVNVIRECHIEVFLFRLGHLEIFTDIPLTQILDLIRRKIPTLKAEEAEEERQIAISQQWRRMYGPPDDSASR